MASSNTGSKAPEQSTLSKITREGIIEAAVKLFFEKGFSDTTLDDIAAALGVSKPYIYRIFPSKAALLEEICTRAHSAIVRFLVAAKEFEAPIIEKICSFIENSICYIVNNYQSFAVSSQEEMHLDQEGEARIYAMRQNGLAELANLIAAGGQSGEFATVDTAVACEILMGMIGWTSVWYRPGGGINCKHIVQEMLGMTRRMLSAH